MGCERWREALSAKADGETVDFDEALVTAHVAGCPDCRSFDAGLARLHRAMRVAPAERVPDLTPAILAGAAADRLRFGLTLGLRWVLVVIAAIEMGMASPDLLGRWHTAGELSTWGMATAIGFLAAAAAPRRAGAMIPMLGCAAALTAFVSVRDIVEGRSGVTALAEAPHGLLVLGVGLLAWLWHRDRTEFRPEPEAYTVGERSSLRARNRRAA